VFRYPGKQVLEKNSGAVEAQNRPIEAHLVAVEAHHGALEAYNEALEASNGAVEGLWASGCRFASLIYESECGSTSK
jgi:hypothetical protein